MSIGDVYKITLNCQAGSQVLQNVFHYRQTLGVTGGNILAQEFINEVVPHIQNIVSTATSFKSVEWLNYNDLSDFGIDTSIDGSFGLRGGETLPVFNAWGFQYVRETRATRNGSKRFAVISETDQAFGGPAPGFLPTLEATAAGLAQFVNFGGSEIWRPVIARLSTDGATVLLTNDVKDVVYKRMTTQNSRKPY